MKNKLSKEERIKRVVARGESSNHSHVVVGDAEIEKNEKGEIIVTVGSEGAILKHIMEKEYVETGIEKWTGEHHDIPLEAGTYKYVPQLEYDPYNEVIRAVRD